MPAEGQGGLSMIANKVPEPLLNVDPLMVTKESSGCRYYSCAPNRTNHIMPSHPLAHRLLQRQQVEC